MGHIIFRKSYASSARFVRYTHETAYLLAKGDAKLPRQPTLDVINMPYSGNKIPPTQKPVAAQRLDRDWLGMELDETHAAAASRRLAYWGERRAAA